MEYHTRKTSLQAELMLNIADLILPAHDNITNLSQN